MTVSYADRQLGVLPNEVFLDPTVDYLDVSGNGLKEIDDRIKELQRLVFFQSGNNPLESFPEGIFALHELKELVINYALFSTIPLGIGALSHLTIIRITDCKELTSIPDDLYSLPLVELDLGGNAILEISSKISQLSQTLTKLDFAANRISKVPVGLFELVNLVFISLYKNPLKSLPDEWHKLPVLKDVHLGECELEELPRSICSLHEVTDLAIQDNQLKKLPPTIGNMGKLRRLVVSGNQLKVLPLSLESRLEKLTLRVDNNPFAAHGEEGVKFVPYGFPQRLIPLR